MNFVFNCHHPSCVQTGEVPQGEQEQDTEDELMQVASITLKDAEPQMFIPFDPFAPLTDDNKLTTIDELAHEVEKEPSIKVYFHILFFSLDL